MKRYALLGAMLTVGVIACTPPAPPEAACKTVNPEPASSVTQTGIKTNDAKLAVLLPTDIDGVEPNRILADPTNIAAGDVIAANCNDGLLRKVTNVTTQTGPSNGLSPQAIRKVYIETAAASLEEVVTDGTADVNFGQMAFDQADLSSAVPGVTAQEVTGTLTIKNARFNLSAADVTFNGTVKSTLDPKFNLVFDGGSVKTFEVGLGGSLAVDLKAAMNLKAGAAAVSERTLWQGDFKRVFLVGAVPVVVVATPRLVVAVRAVTSRWASHQRLTWRTVSNTTAMLQIPNGQVRARHQRLVSTPLSHTAAVPTSPPLPTCVSSWTSSFTASPGHA
jgi:hypothetical protein